MSTMNRLLQISLFAIMLICIESKAAINLDYGPKARVPSEEVETPHIKWLKPNAAGPVKALFITYRTGMREVVELAQRLELKYQVFALDTPNVFRDKVNSCNPCSFSQASMEKELRQKLKQKYDLIVLGNISWKALPLELRYKILTKVKKGVSLLAYISGKDDFLIKALKKRKKVSEEISFLFPYKGLPAFYKYNDFKSFLDSTLEISQFGKGKIILLKGYTVPYPQSLTPGTVRNPLAAKLVNYDYYLAYICHLMLYAAGKVPEVKIEGGDYLKSNRNAIPSINFALNSKIKTNLSYNILIRNKDNKIIQSINKKLSISPGENKVSFNVKSIPAGDYFADIFLRGEKGLLNFGSFFLQVSSDVNIGKIDIKRSYRKKERISGKISVVNPANISGLTARITQLDNFDRIIKVKTLPVKTKGNYFHLEPTVPLSIMQYLEVELLKNNKVLDKKRVYFSISDLYPQKDIRSLIWLGCRDNSFLFHNLTKEIYQAGFDTIYTPSWESKYAAVVPRANLYYCPYVVRMHYGPRSRCFLPKKKTAGKHERWPCLTNPAYRESIAQKLSATAKEWKHFSTLEYSMGDESRFGIEEYCFSPTCKEFFAKFLSKEYQTVKKMNQEYNTTYKKFSDVQPVLLKQAIKDPELIPIWVDFRRCMESNWANIYQFGKDTVQKIIPKGKIGYCGSDTYINSFCAADFWKLMQVMGFNGVYQGAFVPRAVHDFAKPDVSLLGAGYYGGYHSDRSTLVSRYLPWQRLFKGAHSFWVWHAYSSIYVYGISGNIMAPDFSFYNYFKENIKEVKEIKSGIGKLLISSKMDNDGIAVLYSPSSVHLSTLTDGFPKMETVQNGLNCLLEDSGYGFQIISSEQLAKGILNEKKFKVLLLPYSQALSVDEIEKILSFASKGGTVIADLRPGVCDEHGKPYPKSKLDELFGVKQNTTNPTAVKGQILLKKQFKNRFSSCSDKSLKINGASSLGNVFIKDIPCFLTNNYGKGKGVLLNFSLSGYSVVETEMENYDARLGKDSQNIITFFKSLLSYAKVDKKIKITPHIPGLKVYQFQNNGQSYIGILQDPPEKHIKYVTGKAKVTAPRPATLTLPAKKYIYDIRKGVYLGYSDKLTTSVEVGRAQLFGILPYKVEKIELKAPQQVARGMDLEYGIKVHANASPLGLHIIRLSLISPKGEIKKYYSNNFELKDGKLSGKISLALNETPGKWIIRVKDIASGKMIEKNFIVKGKR